jgi:hypothetical protein
LRLARPRHQAVIEDVDYRAPRGLDRALFQKLAQGDWIDVPQNLIIEGPTGVGKSWLRPRPQGVPRQPLRPSTSAFSASLSIWRWLTETDDLRA